MLEYTANILTGDVAKYPVHFINALAATLARRMHRSLSKKGAKNFQEIWAEYNAVMAEAKLADTRESKEKEGNYTDPILEAGGFE